MAIKFDDFDEFEQFAALLQMPVSERLGILNIAEDVYHTLRQGDAATLAAMAPEFERRLSYALPLMRRLARNSPVVALPARRKAA